MMNQILNLISLPVLIAVLFGCSNDTLPEDIVSSNGGRLLNNTTCPTCYNDVIIPLSKLSISGNSKLNSVNYNSILDYIETNNVSTITQLLNALPPHYQSNFSLVEHTKGEGQSDVNFLRIVLYGPDGYFMMNIGTKPEDPKYNLLDCAELNVETGHWEFSQLDFTKRKPVLIKEPNECKRCHGTKDPSPIWGTSLDWPGVFGDNEAPGLTGDALSMRHIKRMNEIRNNHGGSDRFDFLKWRTEEKLLSGGFRRIADNAFGPELLVSNLIFGTAIGRSIFHRLKTKAPEKYAALKSKIILTAYQEQNQAEKPKLNQLFEELGLDVDESFSIATLAEQEIPQTNWSLGDGDLYEQVYLQVLHDLSTTDPIVKQILKNTEVKSQVFNCENVVNNVWELMEYKMIHMYRLRGKARYEVNKVYYPLEVEKVFDLILEPVKDQLVPYLEELQTNS